MVSTYCFTAKEVAAVADCKHDWNSYYGSRCTRCSVEKYVLPVLNEYVPLLKVRGTKEEKMAYYMDKMYGKSFGKGSDNFVGFSSKGEITFIVRDNGCAGSLKNVRPSMRYLWGWPWSNDVVDTAINRKFYSWVVHESPWADAILTKDPVEAFTKGVWYDTQNVSRFEFMSGHASIRYCREQQGKIKQFYDAQEKWDLTPNFAFFMFHVGNWSHEYNKFNILPMTGDHTPFYVRFMKRENLKQFLKNKVPPNDRSSFDRARNWNSLVNAFNPRIRPKNPELAKYMSRNVHLGPTAASRYDNSDALQYIDKIKKDAKLTKRMVFK